MWFRNASNIPFNRNKLSKTDKQTSNQLKKLAPRKLPKRTPTVVMLRKIPIEPIKIEPKPWIKDVSG